MKNYVSLEKIQFSIFLKIFFTFGVRIKFFFSEEFLIISCITNKLIILPLIYRLQSGPVSKKQVFEPTAGPNGPVLVTSYICSANPDDKSEDTRVYNGIEEHSEIIKKKDQKKIHRNYACLTFRTMLPLHWCKVNE